MSRLVVISCSAWLAALSFVGACRPGEGQRCVCENECRGGLVCAQGGRVLEDKECVDPGDDTPGECIRQEDVAASSEEGEVVEDPIYHDVGGKRDFEPGPVTDAASSTSEASSTTASSSSSTTSSSTSAP